MSNNGMKPVVNVFIFRRDLRIYDNLALNKLAQNSKHPVLPIFIFNPVQILPDKNAYYSANAVQFMIESLHELRMECKDSLCFFHGYDIAILDQLIKHFMIDAVAFNTDYTPFAKARDQQLEKWCNHKGISLFTAEDYSLFPMGFIMTDSNKPYEVFTPFYRKCLKKANTISKPSPTAHITFYSGKVPNKIKDIASYVTQNKMIAVKGGRSSALHILHNVKNKQFAQYDTKRDIPSIDGTTKLSAYLKFGNVSIREVFDAFKNSYGINHGLVRELIWREFYSHVSYHFPKILDGQIGGTNQPFKERYRNMTWDFNKEFWTKWCQGNTGYPMVDAGMRQMNATGWMHNRCRMITSMFLTKDLQLDWKLGERYFAQKLVDYDPCSNNGGWQWCSSTGTDSQPYFRVLSPILQGQRFDKDAEYIKKWIPELKDVSTKDILNWEIAHVKYPNVSYPKPIVNHKEQVEKLITIFKNT